MCGFLMFPIFFKNRSYWWKREYSSYFREMCSQWKTMQNFHIFQIKSIDLPTAVWGLIDGNVIPSSCARSQVTSGEISWYREDGILMKILVLGLCLLKGIWRLTKKKVYHVNSLVILVNFHIVTWRVLGSFFAKNCWTADQHCPQDSNIGLLSVD